MATKEKNEGIILRVYRQELDEINIKDAPVYIESLGMEIIQWLYSSFGTCYFIEVKEVVDNMPSIIDEVSKNKKFDWDAY